MPWWRGPSLGTLLASGGTWQRTQGLCGLLDSVCRSVWAVRHVCAGLCVLLDSVCRSVWAVRHVCVGLCGLLDSVCRSVWAVRQCV